MPRRPNLAPVYRRHKPTNQAVCTVRIEGGGSKDIYLGKWDSEASKVEFRRVLAMVATNGGHYPDASRDITVNEAMVRYVKYIDRFYLDPSGSPTGTAEDIKVALGYLKRLFGSTPLAEFGPPELDQIREAMIRDGRVRIQVNKRASQIRQFVKWCVSQRLTSALLMEELRSMKPVDVGRYGVKEGEEVQPADPGDVDKAVPFMPPAVAAIVGLLRLTGARPSEIMRMRPCDINRARDVWEFRPSRHKTTWRGKKRIIHLGPKAKDLLAPWLLGAEPEQIIFSPARSEEIRNRRRSEERQTPAWKSHMLRNEQKRLKAKRKPATQYNRRTLAQAISRACKKAKVTAFSAYQLRHLKAVELREQYGLEVARAVLGHSFNAMTDHYSKAADGTLATKAAAEVG